MVPFPPFLFLIYFSAKNSVNFVLETMGITGSSRRRTQHQQPPEEQQPSVFSSHVVFSVSSQYPNPYRDAGYNPPPLPAHDFHRCPIETAPPVAACVDQQKTVMIKHDVNVKKDSIKVVEDDQNPGRFLLYFQFDATVPGSITVVFFGKEDVQSSDLIATKEALLKPVTVPFEQGLHQIFKQPSGTGMDFSMFDESELTKENDSGVFPLVIKAEVCLLKNDGLEENSTRNSLISLAVFDKKGKNEYLVRVRKQILRANGEMYELKEIYGVGNSLDVESDENDIGKECVICLSELRDTTVLPCRHMCMCSGCAQVLQFQSRRCPICRQAVEGFLKIQVNDEDSNG